MSIFRTQKQVKVLLAATLTAAIAVSASACVGDSSAAPTNDAGKTVVKYQGYPSQVLPAELAAELGYFENIELEWIANVNGGPEQLQGVATKSTDFGGAFNGAVVKLRDSGAKVKAVYSYYGADEKTNSVLAVLEGSAVHSARDLIGRSVGVNTLGAQSEFTIRQWLEKEGLTADEVAQVQLKTLPAGTSEQVLREEQIDSVLISSIQYNLAAERGGLRTVFNDAEILGQESLGSIAVRDEYIEQNPEVVRELVEGSARALRWTQLADPREVRETFAKILTERDGPDAAALSHLWQSSGIATPGGVIQDKEYTRWADWLEAHNELKNPGLTTEDYFTNEFNPYANGKFAPDADENGK